MIETYLVSLLTGDSTISGLIGSRMYPSHLPATPTYPAIVYNRISGPRSYTTSGQSPLFPARFQIDAYAETYAGAKTLAEAIRDKLSGYKDASIRAAFLDNDMDDYESDADIYRVSSDYIIWSEES